jgi:uncharacterized linocin/CFP29 family protein
MNHLLRPLAPISDHGWSLIESEARDHLKPALAARKLVDFSGPHDYEFSSVSLGRAAPLGPTPFEGVTAHVRRLLPLTEVKVNFTVSREALLDADRGALDVDLDDLDRAARQLAVTENTAVFHGWTTVGICGASEASTHDDVPLGDPEHFPRAVARATELLRTAGIDGPYGLALDPDAYTAAIETTERGGHLLLNHLGAILSGPVIWAPGVHGGVVLSQRGGDFVLTSGQDISIGYGHHDSESVTLYLEETFTFQVATPEAVVALTR